LELIASFTFIFSYLIIKNYSIPDGEEMSNWQDIVKPILIAFVYEGSLLMASNTSGGSLNPSLVIDIWIWGAGANNFISPEVGKTWFNYVHYGRYIWVYILAPYVAALMAGFLS
jgi:glycerol uptake facilitator-like aquaporin